MLPPGLSFSSLIPSQELSKYASDFSILFLSLGFFINTGENIISYWCNLRETCNRTLRVQRCVYKQLMVWKFRFLSWQGTKMQNLWHDLPWLQLLLIQPEPEVLNTLVNIPCLHTIMEYPNNVPDNYFHRHRHPTYSKEKLDELIINW
ncbi:hypothetical protein P8452_26523 [Trifolium repens]|nr:hypothetical protein P8452_26523 [Trifolium repens]